MSVIYYIIKIFEYFEVVLIFLIITCSIVTFHYKVDITTNIFYIIMLIIYIYNESINNFGNITEFCIVIK
jgi:hypothetical protein